MSGTGLVVREVIFKVWVGQLTETAADLGGTVVQRGAGQPGPRVGRFAGGLPGKS
jgi:hypothetical protein